MSEWIIILTLIFPLAGGLLSYASSRFQFAITGVLVGFIGSIVSIGIGVSLQWNFHWLQGYTLAVNVDFISLLLIALVNGVSLMVHIFSLSYMKGDRGIYRYFLKLGFFTTSMLGLLISDSFILLFVFWELVGVASYLLIGFWYQKKGVPHAARTAFMVNRVADVALFIGLVLLIVNGVTAISESQAPWAFLPSLLIVIGAFGKSAQLPFSGWLVKAMAGPTPVSALIHAATMVAAGVYLLIRVSPFLHEEALTIVAIVGVVTAFYAGACAVFQTDIKRVLAYSTISQLGYMIVGVGVGGSDAALFHLITHAFFKAGLFLGAGSIIHYLHKEGIEDAQDMKTMGGLKSLLPWTFRSFLICSLALAGVPFFSGFMSKDGILIAAWVWAESHGSLAYLVPDIAFVTAFITALYVGRMVLLVFLGSPRTDVPLKNNTESVYMKLPLLVLAAGCFWFCYSWNPLAHETWLLDMAGLTSTEANHSFLLVMILSIVLMVAGLALAYGFFGPKSVYSQQFAKHEIGKTRIWVEGLFLNRIYAFIGDISHRLGMYASWLDRALVDGFLHFLAVSTVVFSKVVALVDRFVVDGPVNFIGYGSVFMGKRLAGISGKDAQSQLSWLFFGIILILVWILFF